MAQHGPGSPEAHDSRIVAAPFTQEAVDWFVNLQANPNDPQTVRAFRVWSESDPRHAAAFAKVAAMWGAPEFLLATANVAEKTGLATPLAKSSAKRKGAKKFAAGIAVIVIVLGLTQLPSVLLRLRADYITATGERRAITLPDGSTMTLDTQTAVALDFRAGRRDVALLEGEAYFDVQHDPEHPFHVNGRFGRVEVKGTAFSVQTDAGTDTIILGRGLVDVERLARPSDHAGLVPGEAVGVTASTILPVRPVDIRRSLAWVEGRISFADRPLGQVLDDLRRYYPGRIFVTNTQIEQVTVSGNYRLDQPATILRSLADAAGASMTSLPGGVIILH